jgi:hypothetical protein
MSVILRIRVFKKRFKGTFGFIKIDCDHLTLRGLYEVTKSEGWVGLVSKWEIYLG